MGNKLAKDLSNKMVGIEVSTESLQKVFSQYSEKVHGNERMKRKKAIEFLNALFEIYQVPKMNEEKVKINIIKKNFPLT